jgi:hypothetical protein
VALTPLSGAPVMVGASRLVTDSDGEFSITIPRNNDASVSSDLQALRFESFNGDQREVLTGSASQIAEFIDPCGGKLEIAAKPLVRPEAFCRSFGVADGGPVLRFPYSNRQSSVLKVNAGDINSLGSISGVPEASGDFLPTDETLPDGHFAFEWPLSHFLLNNSDSSEWVFASWRLLGQEVVLNQLTASVPFCSGEGRYAECYRVASDIDSELIRQAKQSVKKITVLARKASLRRRWRVPNRLSLMWDRQSGRNLAYIKNLVSSLPRIRYICASDPAPDGCTRFNYPKRVLDQYFAAMGAGRLSRDLPEVGRAHALERWKFRSIMSRAGDSYVACPD